MGFIYKITNTKNNKIYIGKTIGSINKRWREHKSNALNKTDNYLLHLAMRKYGIENFIIEIVEECPNELLNEKEIYYIKFFNSYIGQDKNKNCGYNMTPGGEGKNYDSYDKIFELWDAGNSISQIAFKIKYNRDTIRRILIDYENYSIEESNRRAHVLSGLSKSKSIIQYDLEGNFIKEFDSVSQAERETKISHSNIINVANHKKGHKSAGGYRWEYK